MPETEPVELSIILPMRDESLVVDDRLRRLDPVVGGFHGGCEVIAIDDASADSTWQRLREGASARPWLRGIRLACPSGQHAATFAGLAAARGRAILTMDADLEVSPEDLTKLVDGLQHGHDLVFGTRKHPQSGFFRQIVGPAVVRFLVHFAVGRPPAGISTFLAVRSRVVEAALMVKSPRPVTPYHLMLGAPRSVSCVEVREGVRPAGRSKYGLLRLLRLTADIFFGYTSLPEAALFLSACAVPAGVVALWLLAAVLSAARFEGLAAFCVFLGVIYGLAAVTFVLLLVGELALRAASPERPLYCITETF